MTTYRCAACGMGVETEAIKELDLVEVKPCEVCLKVVEEEGHEKGLEKGREEKQDKAYKEGYEKGRKEGFVKGYVATVEGKEGEEP